MPDACRGCNCCVQLVVCAGSLIAPAALRNIQTPRLLHPMRMKSKGLARLALLVVTAVLGAGITLGAMGGPILLALQQTAR